MGWTISHGNTPSGNLYRSASAMHDVGRHISHLVTATEWRDVKELFRLAQRADGPFEIPARQAGHMAAVLHKAADHPLMPTVAREDDLADAGAVHELADAASRAAAARRAWKWS